MIKKVLLGLAVLVGVFVGVGFLLPSEYAVERKVVISADRTAIYPLVSTPARWPEWTPWTVEKYPKMKATYSGPASGVGAKSAWTDPENGNGSFIITKSSPSTGIEYDMFFDGYSKSVGTIAFSDASQGVEVSMKMTGDMGSNPIGRYFGLMMDGMMGGEFESGLSKLKTVAESSTTAAAKS